MNNRPNILFILADQMRGQAMACAGDANVDTPNLDRLAAEGVRFTSACSSYPVCVPFRFSLMTGECAHTRNIPALLYRLSPAERTIAQEFNDAGYETSYIGKWHLYGLQTDYRSKERVHSIRVPKSHRGGFKRWHGFEILAGYFDPLIYHNDDEKPTIHKGYQTDVLFDIAMNEIDDLASQDKPFMMMLSFEPPHNPYIGPEPLMRKYKHKELEYRKNVMFHPDPDWKHLAEKCCVWKTPDLQLMPESEAEEGVRKSLSGYYAQIENADNNIGRMLDYLEEKGILENTIVIFTSDHGDLHNSHGFFSKQFPFEESVNIPLIVRHPESGICGGRTISEPTCTEDFFPTLLGLAGLAPVEDKVGTDLAPVMRGQVSELSRNGVYLEFVAELRPGMPFFCESWRALRNSKYKYVLSNREPFALYDLESDPYEMRNLIKDPEYSEIKSKMHQQLLCHAHKTQDDLW